MNFATRFSLSLELNIEELIFVYYAANLLFPCFVKVKAKVCARCAVCVQLVTS